MPSTSTTSPQRSKSSLPEGFKCVANAKEGHGQQIYSIAWSRDLYQDYDDSYDGDDDHHHETRCRTLQCFATCGGNIVSIYEVHQGEGAAIDKKTNIELRQGYVDPNENETFYACVFGGRSLGRPFGYGPIKPTCGTEKTVLLQKSPTAPVSDRNSRKRTRLTKEHSSTSSSTAANQSVPEDLSDSNGLFQALVNTELFDGPQLLCAAGTGAVIKVIDTCRRMLYTTLSGHGDEIYDLKFSPTDEWLLLSASKDESLRMWNVKTSTCVAIFAGHEGHRDCVLSVAWHSCGHQFASGGMDTTVKLWAVGEGSDVSEAIVKSKSVKATRWDVRVDPNLKHRLIYEQTPIFSTGKVHTNYVDVVQYVGDLILSKDTHDMIVMWKPITTKTSRGSNTKTQQRLPNEVVALREFKLKHCDVWFIRFATDRLCRMLAIGNLMGDIKIFDIGSNPDQKHYTTLSNPNCTTAIRMVAFNHDAKFIVAVSDDASVWLWEALQDSRKG